MHPAAALLKLALHLRILRVRQAPLLGLDLPLLRLKLPAARTRAETLTFLLVASNIAVVGPEKAC